MTLIAQELESALRLHKTEISALNALLKVIGENGNVASFEETFSGETKNSRTPNLLRVSNSGTITPIVYSFSVYNSGFADGLILGETIKPKESFNFSAGAINNFYTAESITYDGTGTELVIIYNS
jgi:hypothetical protein